MSLQPYQQRVVDERLDLNRKMTSLVAFFSDPRFLDCPLEERVRMRDQLHTMLD